MRKAITLGAIMKLLKQDIEYYGGCPDEFIRWVVRRKLTGFREKFFSKSRGYVI